VHVINSVVVLLRGDVAIWVEILGISSVIVSGVCEFRKVL
jgi:hypothetical protein